MLQQSGLLAAIKSADPRLLCTIFPHHLLHSSHARPSSRLVLLFSASSSSPRAASDLEQARPQTSGEEELQLQLALAMSREESQKVEDNTQTHHMCLWRRSERKQSKKKNKRWPIFMQPACPVFSLLP